MILTLVLFIVTCALLILSILLFPKIQIKNFRINTFWIICLISALLMIIFQCVSFTTIKDTLLSDNAINPIKILILFFSMTFLSIYLDELNFFSYLASKASKLAKNNQISLFLILYAFVSLLTIFTSNDIVILTFTPFICFFAKNAKIDPIPYLIGEFAAANTWSMMLIIGNPTNIYLASSLGIDFIGYIKVMFLPTLLSGLFELFLIFILFRKRLQKSISYEAKETKIDNIPNFIIGISHLSICLVLLIISSYLNIPMWLVALCSSISLVLAITISNIIQHKNFSNIIKTTKRLPYNLIPFVLSMFVIVSALNEQGISSYLASILGNELIIYKYGFSSFIFSNIMNNIPMSVLFSTLPQMSQLENLKAIYASIIGSNIGAFLTPLGALAGIMFTNLLSKYNVKYSFIDFIKYGTIISIPTLLIALSTLLITI